MPIAPEVLENYLKELEGKAGQPEFRDLIVGYQTNPFEGIEYRDLACKILAAKKDIDEAGDDEDEIELILQAVDKITSEGEGRNLSDHLLDESAALDLSFLKPEEKQLYRNAIKGINAAREEFNERKEAERKVEREIVAKVQGWFLGADADIDQVHFLPAGGNPAYSALSCARAGNEYKVTFFDVDEDRNRDLQFSISNDGNNSLENLRIIDSQTGNLEKNIGSPIGVEDLFKGIAELPYLSTKQADLESDTDRSLQYYQIFDFSGRKPNIQYLNRDTRQGFVVNKDEDDRFISIERYRFDENNVKQDAITYFLDHLGRLVTYPKDGSSVITQAIFEADQVHFANKSLLQEHTDNFIGVKKGEEGFTQEFEDRLKAIIGRQEESQRTVSITEEDGSITSYKVLKVAGEEAYKIEHFTGDPKAKVGSVKIKEVAGRYQITAGGPDDSDITDISAEEAAKYKEILLRADSAFFAQEIFAGITKDDFVRFVESADDSLVNPMLHGAIGDYSASIDELRKYAEFRNTANLGFSVHWDDEGRIVRCSKIVTNPADSKIIKAEDFKFFEDLKVRLEEGRDKTTQIKVERTGLDKIVDSKVVATVSNAKGEKRFYRLERDGTDSYKLVQINANEEIQKAASSFKITLDGPDSAKVRKIGKQTGLSSGEANQQRLDQLQLIYLKLLSEAEKLVLSDKDRADIGAKVIKWFPKGDLTLGKQVNFSPRDDKWHITQSLKKDDGSYEAHFIHGGKIYKLEFGLNGEDQLQDLRISEGSYRGSTISWSAPSSCNARQLQIVNSLFDQAEEKPYLSTTKAEFDAQRKLSEDYLRLFSDSGIEEGKEYRNKDREAFVKRTDKSGKISIERYQIGADEKKERSVIYTQDHLGRLVADSKDGSSVITQATFDKDQGYFSDLASLKTREATDFSRQLADKLKEKAVKTVTLQGRLIRGSSPDYLPTTAYDLNGRYIEVVENPNSTVSLFRVEKNTRTELKQNEVVDLIKAVEQVQEPLTKRHLDNFASYGRDFRVDLEGRPTANYKCKKTKQPDIYTISSTSGTALTQFIVDFSDDSAKPKITRNPPIKTAAGLVVSQTETDLELKAITDQFSQKLRSPTFSDDELRAITSKLKEISSDEVMSGDEDLAGVIINKSDSIRSEKFYSIEGGIFGVRLKEKPILFYPAEKKLKLMAVDSAGGVTFKDLEEHADGEIIQQFRLLIAGAQKVRDIEKGDKFDTEVTELKKLTTQYLGLLPEQQGKERLNKNNNKAYTTRFDADGYLTIAQYQYRSDQPTILVDKPIEVFKVVDGLLYKRSEVEKGDDGKFVYKKVNEEGLKTLIDITKSTFPSDTVSGSIYKTRDQADLLKAYKDLEKAAKQKSITTPEGIKISETSSVLDIVVATSQISRPLEPTTDLVFRGKYSEFLRKEDLEEFCKREMTVTVDGSRYRCFTAGTEGSYYLATEGKKDEPNRNKPYFTINFPDAIGLPKSQIEVSYSNPSSKPSDFLLKVNALVGLDLSSFDSDFDSELFTKITAGMAGDLNRASFKDGEFFIGDVKVASDSRLRNDGSAKEITFARGKIIKDKDISSYQVTLDGEADKFKIDLQPGGSASFSKYDEVLHEWAEYRNPEEFRRVRDILQNAQKVEVKDLAVTSSRSVSAVVSTPPPAPASTLLKSGASATPPIIPKSTSTVLTSGTSSPIAPPAPTNTIDLGNINSAVAGGLFEKRLKDKKASIGKKYKETPLPESEGEKAVDYLIYNTSVDSVAVNKINRAMLNVDKANKESKSSDDIWMIDLSLLDKKVLIAAYNEHHKSDAGFVPISKDLADKRDVKTRTGEKTNKLEEEVLKGLSPQTRAKLEANSKAPTEDEKKNISEIISFASDLLQNWKYQAKDANAPENFDLLKKQEVAEIYGTPGTAITVTNVRNFLDKKNAMGMTT